MPTTLEPDQMTDRMDLDRLRTMTDAEIESAVLEDPDTFIPDAARMANACAVSPKVMEFVDAGLRRHDAGRPPSQNQQCSK